MSSTASASCVVQRPFSFSSTMISWGSMKKTSPRPTSPALILAATVSSFALIALAGGTQYGSRCVSRWLLPANDLQRHPPGGGVQVAGQGVGIVPPLHTGADGCGAVGYTAGLALLAEGFAMRPYRLGMGVLVVLVACQVSQPPCLAQQTRVVPQQPRVVPQGHGEQVFSVAFSPDGKMVAAGCGDGRIELWEVASHKRRAMLRGHTEEVTSLVFSGDGKLLASRGAEGT